MLLGRTLVSKQYWRIENAQMIIKKIVFDSTFKQAKFAKFCMKKQELTLLLELGSKLTFNSNQGSLTVGYICTK